MADKGGKAAQLTVDGTTIDLPVYSGTEGPDVIDVGQLTSKGYFTYDPGFVSTASCESSITYIDGDAGIGALPGTACVPLRGVPSPAERAGPIQGEGPRPRWGTRPSRPRMLGAGPTRRAVGS